MSERDTTEMLLDLLDLDGEPEARTEEDIFTGRSPIQPRQRVFGGQVLGQSVVAASRTVAGDRPIHSLHGYFLRPGDALKPITFGVQRLRDGRSFSARRVHAYQNGEPIMSLIASFQAPAEGIEHQEPMPSDIPDPETLPSSADILGRVDDPLAQDWAYNRPFDVRYVEPPIYFPTPDMARQRTAQNTVWLKTTGPMPDDQALHRAALAYASDYTILESAMRRHGLPWTTPGLSVASLDHAMWWHRPVRVDEWLLYVQTSPSASGARGLGMGRIYNRAGDLVASVAQEGMVRLPHPPA